MCKTWVGTVTSWTLSWSPQSRISVFPKMSNVYLMGALAQLGKKISILLLFKVAVKRLQRLSEKLEVFALKIIAGQNYEASMLMCSWRSSSMSTQTSTKCYNTVPLHGKKSCCDSSVKCPDLISGA